MAKQSIEDGIQIPVEPTPEVKTEQQRLFSEDDVQKIRQQEKDKMYKRLEDADTRVKSMEEQLSVLSKEREEAIKAAEEKARAEAELLRQREMEELSAKDLLAKREDEFNKRLNQVEEEWKVRFNELEQQRQAQEALLEKERYLQSLESYRQRRLQDEQETIIPELRDLVSGNNEEEIENSIAVLRDRSSAIIESIQQAGQTTRLRGAPVTAPPTGPLENQQEYQTMSAEDIRNMPMDQYVKMRERLLQARPSRGRF
jgi:DNA repair exonuclease SbcCD ATPase subunit